MTLPARTPSYLPLNTSVLRRRRVGRRETYLSIQFVRVYRREEVADVNLIGLVDTGTLSDDPNSVRASAHGHLPALVVRGPSSLLEGLCSQTR